MTRLATYSDVDTALARQTLVRAKPEKDWLSRKEAADYLTRKGRPISAGRLANMASNNNAGRGPSFTRPCWNRVQYRRTDLDAWLQRESVVVP